MAPIKDPPFPRCHLDTPPCSRAQVSYRFSSQYLCWLLLLPRRNSLLLEENRDREHPCLTLTAWRLIHAVTAWSSFGVFYLSDFVTPK